MKTETKVSHTPGPWQMTSTVSHIFVNEGAGHDGVIIKLPCDDSPLQWACKPASLENTANARLIAAAPVMLDTLQVIADLAGGHGDVCELIARRARAAIAKAEPCDS